MQIDNMYHSDCFIAAEKNYFVKVKSFTSLVVIILCNLPSLYPYLIKSTIIWFVSVT